MSEYNNALDWAASWIENSVDGNERVQEFARNMAMSIRAAKLKIPEPTLDDVQCAYLLAQEEAKIGAWVERYPQFEADLREFAAINEAMEKIPDRTYTPEEEARLQEIARAVVAKVIEDLPPANSTNK
jgi:hypothetical protein